MLKLLRNKKFYLLFAVVFIIVFVSCSSPKNAKYKNRANSGSSSYYGKSSELRINRNAISISRNYKVRNKKGKSN